MNLQPLLLYFYPFVCTNCYVTKLDIPYTRGHINSVLVLAYKKAGLSVEPQGIMHSVLHSGANVHHFLESKSRLHLQKPGQGVRLCSALCQCLQCASQPLLWQLEKKKKSSPIGFNLLYFHCVPEFKTTDCKALH